MFLRIHENESFDLIHKISLNDSLTEKHFWILNWCFYVFSEALKFQSVFIKIVCKRVTMQSSKFLLLFSIEEQKSYENMTVEK